jgi:hypothetical protein
MEEMGYKEVKELIDEALDPLEKSLLKIEDTVSVLPALNERLSGYIKLEEQVANHQFLLCGVDGKPGVINDIKNLKNKDKKNLSLFFKIVALIGTILGILATGKAFFF